MPYYFSFVGLSFEDYCLLLFPGCKRIMQDELINNVAATNNS